VQVFVQQIDLQTSLLPVEPCLAFIEIFEITRNVFSEPSTNVNRIDSGNEDKCSEPSPSADVSMVDK